MAFHKIFDYEGTEVRKLSYESTESTKVRVLYVYTYTYSRTKVYESTNKYESNVVRVQLYNVVHVHVQRCSVKVVYFYG